MASYPPLGILGSILDFNHLLSHSCVDLTRMVVSFLLKFWCLYQIVLMYRRFCYYCLLIGYQFVPYLVPDTLSPTYERLLELREEVLDMDLRERQLEAELAALPEDLPDSDPPESEVSLSSASEDES